ncbi:MAG: PIN domain-containing protein [Solirubrobacterales bacterium]
MPSAVVVADTGPLLAAADQGDPDHAASVSQLARGDLRFVIPAPVATETAQMIARRLGSVAEAKFHRALATQEVEPLALEDFTRIAELIEQYADFPLGGVDASVIALAERLGTALVLTLDHRHFAAVRPSHCHSLELLPA